MIPIALTSVSLPAKKRILTVCVRLFLEKGYKKTTLAEIIEKVISTNLTYQTPELLSRDWYISADMSKYIAYLIDTLNHDSSISDLLNPYDRIKNYVQKYQEKQKNK